MYSNSGNESLCVVFQARPTMYQVLREMIDKMGYKVTFCCFHESPEHGSDSFSH